MKKKQQNINEDENILKKYVGSTSKELKSVSSFSNLKYILEKKENDSEFNVSNDVETKAHSLTEEEKMLIPIIKEKIEICMWMMKAVVPINQFTSLQKLIDSIGNNHSLKLFSHNSKYSFKQFSISLYNGYKTVLKNRLSYINFYSLLLDDSVNVSSKNQLSVFIRYIYKNGVHTSFLGVKDLGIKGGISENLFNLILELLQEFEINIKDIIAICTDGASNMRGEIHSVIALFKEKVSYIIDYYCICHRLNLVIQHSISSVFVVNDCVDLITDITSYINISPNRLAHLEKIQTQFNKPLISLIQPIAIRWSSVYGCIKSFVDQFYVILIFLNEDAKKNSSEKSKVFMEKIINPEFLIAVSIAKTILEILNQSLLKFQRENTDLGFVNVEIEKLKENLKEENLNKKIKLLINRLIEESSTFLRKIKNFKKISANLSFLHRTTKELVDTVVNCINERFNSNPLITAFLKIFDPNELKKLGNDYLLWNEARELFLKIIRRFKNKFSSFAYRQKIQYFGVFEEVIIPKLQKLKSFSQLCELILKCTRFKESDTIVKIACIALLIPTSSAVVESGFSILSDIHNDKRNKLSTITTNILMICKVNITNEIKDDVINEASIKYLKGMKKRRKINEVLNILYEDGLIPNVQMKKKFYWKKKKETEKIIKEEENKIFFTLELLKKNKNDKNKNYLYEILEEESLDERISDCENFENKIKRKKNVNNKFLNKEMKAIQAALTIKGKKRALVTEKNEENI
jgi:hypothetical protein